MDLIVFQLRGKLRNSVFLELPLDAARRMLIQHRLYLHHLHSLFWILRFACRRSLRNKIHHSSKAPNRSSSIYIKYKMFTRACVAICNAAKTEMKFLIFRLSTSWQEMNIIILKETFDTDRVKLSRIFWSNRDCVKIVLFGWGPVLCLTSCWFRILLLPGTCKKIRKQNRYIWSLFLSPGEFTAFFW